jgi:hypothetical protein
VACGQHRIDRFYENRPAPVEMPAATAEQPAVDAISKSGDGDVLAAAEFLQTRVWVAGVCSPAGVESIRRAPRRQPRVKYL